MMRSALLLIAGIALALMAGEADAVEPLWSYATGSAVESVSISADGEYIATLEDYSSEGNVSFFHKDSSTPLWSYETGSGVYSVALSADGDYIAAGSSDRKVYLFDRDSSTPLWSYETGSGVYSVAISADGKYIAAGSSWGDNKTYLFDKDNSTTLWSYTHEGPVNTVIISADGEYIVACSNNSVYLFGRNSSTPLWNYAAGGGLVDISADGEYIVAGSGSKVYLFHKDNSTPLWSYYTGSYPYVNSVTISADGEYIVVGAHYRDVYLFDTVSGALLWRYETERYVDSVAISADGEHIAVGAHGNVYLFDKDSSTPIWSFWIESLDEELVAISADGEYIVAGDSDKVYLFDALDTFFSDDFEADELAYTQFHSGSNEDNGFYWVQGDSTIGDAYSGSTMFRYYVQGTNSYASGADDSTVTPDVCDRDGNASFFAENICIDLIAAAGDRLEVLIGYEAALHYAIKWDLAAGDRLEVRISSDFNSSQRLGSWTVLKTYEGTSGDWSSSAWFLEEIDLSDFTREQVWIDFHMVSNNGGGKGVLLDSMDVKGREYRNNLAIIDVTTDHFTMAGEEHDLSVTIKSFSREPQTSVTVTAVMRDSNGVRVWPTDHSFNYFSLPVALETGETFTVDPTTAGTNWRWGAELVPGIYTLHVEVWRDDEQQVPDEYRDDNMRNITLVLGANMLGSDEWSGDWSESDGAWSWDGSSSGTLTSDSFIVWNRVPFLVVEAEYDLIDANVKAQVKAGSDGQWSDIEWRAADQQSTLYAIPGANYTQLQLPDQWTGKSSFDKRSVQTFYANLGVVEQLSDGGGNLQDQYVHNSMQIRLVGISDGGSGFFISHELRVMGMDDYRMDIISITPSTWGWIENNEDVTDYNATITYTVTVRNFGAMTDSPVIVFGINGNIYQVGPDTFVGSVSEEEHSWDINNPTKSAWDFSSNKPMEPSSGFFIEPGGTLAIDIEITFQYNSWGATSGTHVLQADVRSWTDYDNTFTSNDPDGEAEFTIDKPDLYIGSISYDSEGFGIIRTDSNGHYLIPEIWNADMEPEFTFYAEGLNNMPSPSNPTPGGSFKITDSMGNIIAGIGSPVSYQALGMAVLEPAADGNVTIFSYYLVLDYNSIMYESNENNNREEIQITITYDTAPIAYIDSNLTLNRTAKGDPYALVGSGIDIGGDITEYIWNSSIDGVLGNEADIQIDTLSLGIHEITLMVKDGVGLWSSPVYTTVWVYALPVAMANHWNDDDSARPDEAVLFRGTASDEDGSIVLYEWDFNGDGIYDWSGSHGDTSYSYVKSGRFEAVLRVTDDDGFVSTDVRDVHVSELGIDPVALVKDNLVYILALFGLLGGLVYWKNMDYSYTPSSKTKPVIHPSPTRSTPMFSPSSMTAIECPSCGVQMEVPKLGMMQKVTCSECGTSGEIEI